MRPWLLAVAPLGLFRRGLVFVAGRGEGAGMRGDGAVDNWKWALGLRRRVDVS